MLFYMIGGIVVFTILYELNRKYYHPLNPFWQNRNDKPLDIWDPPDQNYIPPAPNCTFMAQSMYYRR